MIRRWLLRTFGSAMLLGLFAATDCDGPRKIGGLECAVHVDCPQGEACFRGECMDPGTPRGEVLVELLPSEQSGFVEQVPDASLVLEGEALQNLIIGETLRLGGRLTARLDGVLRSQPVGERFGPSSAPYSAEVVDGAFVTRVSPGPTEHVFVPDNNSLPALYLIRDETTLRENWTIEYPYPDGIVSKEVTLSDESPADLDDVRLRLRGVDDKGVLRASSSRARHQGGGVFRLNLLAGLPPGLSWSLVVEGGDLLPSYTTPVSVDVDDLDAPLLVGSASRRTVSLSLPVLGAGTVEAAQLVMLRPDDGLRLERQAYQSDQALGVPDGEYLLLIVPLGDGGLSARQLVVCVDADGIREGRCSDPGTGAGDLSVEFTRRAIWNGRVFAPDGRALPSVGLRFVSLGTALPIVHDTRTDSTGRFSLRLDSLSGDPDLRSFAAEVLPAGDSAVPLALYREVFDVPENGGTLVLRLPQAELVYGQVRTGGGQALPSVRVNLYSSKAARNGGVNELMLVGTALSDTQGDYVIPLSR